MLLSLSQCIDEVLRLTLIHCGITKQGIATLAARIEERVDKMEFVIIHDLINDDEAAALIKCLCKVNEVMLNRHNLSSEMKPKLQACSRLFSCGLFFE